MVLENYKFVFVNLLVITFLLIIVKYTKYEQPKMVNMEEMVNYIFFDYNYTYRVTSKKEGSVLAIIVISKNNMPLTDFSSIESRLIDKKWILKREYNGLYTFCYGLENRLNIFYPKNGQEKINLPNKNRLSIKDSNNWVINFYYNQGGINECYRE